MQIFITIIGAVVFGAACAYYAKERGRKPIHWFFIGVFFGIFGLIALFLFPSLKPGQKGTENKTEKPPETKEAVTPIPFSQTQKLWYYLDEEQKQLGPMSFEALQRACEKGQVTEQTYVWNEELEAWKLYGDLLSRALS